MQVGTPHERILTEFGQCMNQRIACTRIGPATHTTNQPTNHTSSSPTDEGRVGKIEKCPLPPPPARCSNKNTTPTERSRSAALSTCWLSTRRTTLTQREVKNSMIAHLPSASLPPLPSVLDRYECVRSLTIDYAFPRRSERSERGIASNTPPRCSPTLPRALSLWPHGSKTGGRPHTQTQPDARSTARHRTAQNTLRHPDTHTHTILPGCVRSFGGKKRHVRSLGGRDGRADALAALKVRTPEAFLPFVRIGAWLRSGLCGGGCHESVEDNLVDVHAGRLHEEKAEGRYGEAQHHEGRVVHGHQTVIVVILISPREEPDGHERQMDHVERIGQPGQRHKHGQRQQPVGPGRIHAVLVRGAAHHQPQQTQPPHRTRERVIEHGLQGGPRDGAGLVGVILDEDDEEHHSTTQQMARPPAEAGHPGEKHANSSPVLKHQEAAGHADEVWPDSAPRLLIIKILLVLAWLQDHGHHGHLPPVDEVQGACGDPAGNEEKAHAAPAEALRVPAVYGDDENAHNEELHVVGEVPRPRHALGAVEVRDEVIDVKQVRPPVSLASALLTPREESGVQLDCELRPSGAVAHVGRQVLPRQNDKHVQHAQTHPPVYDCDGHIDARLHPRGVFDGDVG
mmetsp:Transcript_27862/g.80237  ORF Transcript_27862/g.80237 Transcript_27862/m.80237 type:complete len:625 (+) Transcript_27862:247-2121(+)